MLDKSIKKTLVIGSGPIIIGQAAEFDYSGTQACETRDSLGRTFPTLANYAVTIPPGGRTDALVQTVITWRNGDKMLRTRGLDADQTEAAIKATFKMLNIIEEGNKQ